MTEKTARKAIEAWYESLPQYSGHCPAKGTIAGALTVLERLKSQFDLRIEAHTAGSGTQIAGASGSEVSRILALFRETRPFIREGGRTNRGLKKDMENLLVVLKGLDLDGLSPSEREETLSVLQEYLVGKVREFFNRQRLRFEFDPAETTWELVRRILESANERGQAGPVAQYLVGAKLALRFPDEDIRNESSSTADAQLNLSGDFQVRDTVFHVTMAPGHPLYAKCGDNLARGLRVYVIVPEEWLQTTRQSVEADYPGRITVQSIESFISQNVEELSTFSGQLRVDELRKLLESYNERVDRIETDKSLLIEIPENLRS